jgi:hypothetical protein
VYLFGSTEEGTAGPGSDIDLLVVWSGSAAQRRDLQHWLEGWSLCLAEMSYQVYGLPVQKLLDVRFMTPEEASRQVMAMRRGGSALRELPLGSDPAPDLIF